MNEFLIDAGIILLFFGALTAAMNALIRIFAPQNSESLMKYIAANVAAVTLFAASIAMFVLYIALKLAS